MARQAQELVTFEDIAIYLSRVEWDGIAAGQRELYRRVMLDNYDLLMSLGYSGPKPDILHRLERGEEPWVCTPQSTFKWDGPDSPSLGHDGDRSCLEGPSPGWWPGAGGPHVLGERTQPPCQGGRRVPWRLRSSRLLSKLRRREAVAAGGAAGLAPRPRTGGEADDREGLVGDAPQSGSFLLQPESEPQNEELAPQDLRRCNPPGSHWDGLAPGEALAPRGHEGRALVWPGESGAVLSDHCYCAMGSGRPRALQEHDYCRQDPAGARLLQDHQYCSAPRVRHREKLHRNPRMLSANRDWCRGLARRRSQIRRLIHKAKRTLLRRKPGALRPVPRLAARHTQALLSTFCLWVELLQPRGQGPGVMSGRPRGPTVASKPPASDAGGEAAQAQRGQRVHPRYFAQLRHVYDVVLRTVECVFCRDMERGGRSLRKDIRTIGVVFNI